MMEEPGTKRTDIDRESERLAADFLGGDRRAFDRLVLLHQEMVFSLCFRLMGDYDDADDCAQEVFIKVHRHLGGFRFESSFRTWLYRVTVNTCRNRIDSLEYRMRKKKVRVEAGTGDSGRSTPAEIPDGRESALDALRRKEIGGVIQKALDTLPASQKVVVVLRDIEGRSYGEIVRVTGLNEGTVKSKLSRARLKLREALRGKIDEEL